MDSRAFCPAGGWAESSRGGWGRAGLGLGGRSERAGAQRDPETGLRARGWSRSGFAIPLGAGGPEPLPEEQKEKKREGGGRGTRREDGGNSLRGPGPSSGKSRGGLVLQLGSAPPPLLCRGPSPRRGRPGDTATATVPCPQPPSQSCPGAVPEQGTRTARPAGLPAAGGGLRRGAGGGQGLPDALDCRSDVGNRLPSSLACD